MSSELTTERYREEFQFEKAFDDFQKVVLPLPYGAQIFIASSIASCIVSDLEEFFKKNDNPVKTLMAKANTFLKEAVVAAYKEIEAFHGRPITADTIRTGKFLGEYFNCEEEIKTLSPILDSTSIAAQCFFCYALTDNVMVETSAYKQDRTAQCLLMATNLLCKSLVGIYEQNRNSKVAKPLRGVF